MSDDNQLQQLVLAELNREPSVTSAHIGVTANVGVITLSGHVESFAQKEAAETAARRVKGVKALVEEIQVRLPYDSERNDDEIAAAVIDRLAWDVSVPRDSVKVKVENGWITLTGQVDCYYHKAAAEQDVRRLYGVVGVTNQISIKPGVNTTNISNDISCALHRSWFPDPDAITVTAKDGKVRLTGYSHSWHARQVAAEISWGSPGVIDVENNIEIV